MADEKPENLENAIGYQAAVVEFSGKSYNATIYPLDGPCSTPLEWEMPSKHPMGLAAATAARKTNWAMNGKADKLALNTQPQSPTYPIKNGDLVWLSIEGRVYDNPFKIQISGKSIRASPIKSITIDDGTGKPKGMTLGHFISGSKRLKVRIYQHADCSYVVPGESENETMEPVIDDEEEVLTDKHLASDLEDMLDTSRHENPDKSDL